MCRLTEVPKLFVIVHTATIEFRLVPADFVATIVCCIDECIRTGVSSQPRPLHKASWPCRVHARVSDRRWCTHVCERAVRDSTTDTGLQMLSCIHESDAFRI